MQLQQENPPHCPWSDLVQNTQTEVSFTRNRKRREKLDSYLQDKLGGKASCDEMAFHFTHSHMGPDQLHPDSPNL